MFLALDTNCVLPDRVGGLETYVLTLAKNLLRAPWLSRLLLLTRPENRALFSRFESSHCRATLVPRPAPSNLSTANWADALKLSPCAARDALQAHQDAKLKILRDANPDLVHFPGNTINPLHLDLPAVLNVHDLQHRQLPHYFTADEIAHRDRWWASSAQRADAVIATTHFVAADLTSEFHIPGDRIYVAPLPVDDFFAEAIPSPGTPGEGKGEGRAPSIDQRYFLYPASPWPHKNHRRLIRAFTAANLPNTSLILTGVTHSDLPNLPENVRTLGRVDRETLRTLYQNALATIFPSEYEASSFPLLEAMASHCPVASSNIPALADLLADAGLLFHPHDEDAMTRAMIQVATNPTLRADLSGRSAKRIRHFTVDRFLSALRSAYTSALSRRNKEAA